MTSLTSVLLSRFILDLRSSDQENTDWSTFFEEPDAIGFTNFGGLDDVAGAIEQKEGSCPNLLNSLECRVGALASDL